MKSLLMNQAGFTLVETIIGTALSGIVIMSIMSFLNVYSHMNSDARAVNARDEVLLRLRQTIAKQRVLDFIGTRNPDLQNCMGPCSSGSCPLACLHGNEYDLNLYDPNGTQISAGADNGPFYYDLSGAPCGTTRTRRSCLITVTTTFLPYCRTFDRDPSTGRCGQAEYIEFYFSVGSEVDPDTGKSYFPDLDGVLYFNQEDRV